MSLWHLGNTTVRSPFRLREGLIILSTSPLHGNLRGQNQEIALRNLLGEHGIVDLGNDKTHSVGRKWRSALSKLGFLYPKIPLELNSAQHNFGQLDTITPNGHRLISADSVPAMQECFLRAIAAYFLPSMLIKENKLSIFSPLKHTLAIMLSLQEKTDDTRLNFIEMALIVQLTTASDNLLDIVASILKLRERKKNYQNKRQFDSLEFAETAKRYNKKVNTFKDYADTNFRYLKATGLFQTKGKGISLIPEKYIFIEQLIQEIKTPDSAISYFFALTQGAILPTDNKTSALLVLDDLFLQLKKKGISCPIQNQLLDTPADIAIVRHKIEKILSEQNEEAFALRQAYEWQEIVAYMELLNTRKHSKMLKNGDEIEIPPSERPAYLEWILWRAFLAMKQLKNKSYEARRFKIDQDFLPVGTAPGNGPDLIFEFEEFIIVVEVTLTENSRQEAAEGEPVRRHVAEWALKSKKPVYGLFIANRIDSNTAETFRNGVWYNREDQKMKLDIIPMTLNQFKDFFAASFKSQQINNKQIRTLLDQCSHLRTTHEAPMWKIQIDKTVKQYVEQLLSYSEQNSEEFITAKEVSNTLG